MQSGALLLLQEEVQDGLASDLQDLALDVEEEDVEEHALAMLEYAEAPEADRRRLVRAGIMAHIVQVGTSAESCCLEDGGDATECLLTLAALAVLLPGMLLCQVMLRALKLL
jgi:hypothetical protein